MAEGFGCQGLPFAWTLQSRERIRRGDTKAHSPNRGRRILANFAMASTLAWSSSSWLHTSHMPKHMTETIRVSDRGSVLPLPVVVAQKKAKKARKVRFCSAIGIGFRLIFSSICGCLSNSVLNFDVLVVGGSDNTEGGCGGLGKERTAPGCQSWVL